MPIIKLGYLFLRTIAKPVASIVKSQAKQHASFRSACARLAQGYHRYETRLRRNLRNAGILDRIKPLDEQRAVELGANFIGEAIVFMVAGAVLIIDTSSSYRREQARRYALDVRIEQIILEARERRAEANELQMCIKMLGERIERLEAPHSSVKGSINIL